MPCAVIAGSSWAAIVGHDNCVALVHVLTKKGCPSASCIVGHPIGGGVDPLGECRPVGVG